jgi:hypothetical protein
VGLIRAVCTLLVSWARTARSAAVVSDLQIEIKCITFSFRTERPG